MLFHVANIDKILGDLYGVERRALAYLVAAEPECKPVLVGQVLADTAYVYVILARVTPGAAAIAWRASSTLMGRSVSIHTDSE